VLLLLLSFFLYFPFRELSFLFFCATTRVSFFYPILLTVVLSLVVVWCPSKSNDTRREQTTHISLLFSSSYEQTEISSYCYNVFTSAEIQTLYKRFQQLDKKHKGYISEDELLNIPELAINPLAPRIVQLFVNVNFKEFCRLLSLLSKNANEKSKISFMFRVYDVDADGIVSRNDLEIILRQLVGSTLSEEKIDALVQKAMNEVLELENNTSNSDSNNRKNNSSSSNNNNNNATALPGLTESAFYSVFSSGNAELVPTVSIHEDDD
jgi:serine/threonine-protein phosphatase 2B regulatory subunit